MSCQKAFAIAPAGLSCLHVWCNDTRLLPVVSWQEKRGLEKVVMHPSKKPISGWQMLPYEFDQDFLQKVNIDGAHWTPLGPNKLVKNKTPEKDEEEIGGFPALF
eukprot:scaffold59648_cov47-Prasinocladus_malaysianus.AAC.1